MNHFRVWRGCSLCGIGNFHCVIRDAGVTQHGFYGTGMALTLELRRDGCVGMAVSGWLSRNCFAGGQSNAECICIRAGIPVTAGHGKLGWSIRLEAAVRRLR